MVSVVAGLPHGNLVSYNFPTACNLNVDYDWSADVHNNGDSSGDILLGLANYSGPGDMIVTYGGAEHTVRPSEVYWIRQAKNVCEHIVESGKVRFTTIGSYTIWVIGGHVESTAGGESYVIDTHVVLDG